MRFAHLGDCHLGGWRHPELQELNFLSFKEAVSRILQRKLDFVLIAGDLFDSAYPSIEILKRTFVEFRRLKESEIPIFLIAGSHDYSVSGKTFLEVLEKAGFCKNVFVSQERDGKILLEPTVFKGAAIYGFPGKKSGLEVEDISRIKFIDSPGMFKILMLHTTIRDAIGNLPIKSVDERLLPQVDYLALAHLHINYKKENRVYCGPTYPNNISELEELQHGSFYIFDNGKIEKQIIKLKEVISISIEVSSSLDLTSNLITLLEKNDLQDKIVILRVSGILERGKISDIDFSKVESFAKSRGAFVFLKSTSKLYLAESGVDLNLASQENVEQELIQKFREKNPSRFNSLLFPLMSSLAIEKLEDETHITFEQRLMSELKKLI